VVEVVITNYFYDAITDGLPHSNVSPETMSVYTNKKIPLKKSSKNKRDRSYDELGKIPIFCKNKSSR